MARNKLGSTYHIPESKPSSQRNVIAVLDSQCHDIKSLVEAVAPGEWHVRTYSSTGDLLACRAAEPAGCLLLGERLPEGKTGIEVMGELQRNNRMIPTLVVSDRCSLRQVVATMRAGADGFLTKPLDPAELLEDLLYAFSKPAGNPQSGPTDADARQRLSSLNAREMQVVRLVGKGMINKEIADSLGLALITIKVYRSRAMKKLGARNSVEMYQVAIAGGLTIDGKNHNDPPGKD